MAHGSLFLTPGTLALLVSTLCSATPSPRHPCTERGVGAVRWSLEGSELRKLPAACPELDDKIK